MGGGGQPGKGGKGGGPPGKGGVSRLPRREGGSPPGRDRVGKRETGELSAPGMELPLDRFLERLRRHIGPPVNSSQPYCGRCRRLEIREEWLEEKACSLCSGSLSVLPTV